MLYVVRLNRRGKFKDVIFNEIPTGFPANIAMQPRHVPVMAQVLLWKDTWKQLAVEVCLTEQEFLTAIKEVFAHGWGEGIGHPTSKFENVPLESIQAGPLAMKLVHKLQTSSHWEIRVTHGHENSVMLTPRRFLNMLGEVREEARTAARSTKLLAA